MALTLLKEEIMLKRKIGMLFKTKNFTLIVLFIVLYAVFAVLTEGANLSPINIRNMLNSIVIMGMLAVGQSFLLIAGYLDLAAGAIGTTSAVLLGYMLVGAGAPWFLCLLVALVFGIICGIASATLVNRFNFQPFIATLAVSYVVQGIGYIVCFNQTGLASIPISHPVFNFIGTERIINGIVPVTLIIIILFLIVYGIILKKTSIGRMVYLVGGNKAAAHLVGINPKKVSYMCFINGGILFSLAGCLAAFRAKAATVTGITNMAFTGITAAVLGGISFGGGSGGMFGCFLGLLVLNCFNTGMDILRFNTFWQVTFSGILLLIALTFDAITSKRYVAQLYRETKEAEAAAESNNKPENMQSAR